MAFDDLPLIEQLRQILRYNPATGELRWRPRTPDMFSDTPVKGRYVRTAEATCAAWNTKYAGKPALAKTKKSGHLYGMIRGVCFFSHRAAWIVHFGEIPQRQIDHINGDPKDNRIENLRLASRIENARNVKISSRNQTGILGVHPNPGSSSWYAEIGKDGGRLSLGTYRTKAEAVAARRAAEIVLGYHPNHGRR